MAKKVTLISGELFFPPSFPPLFSILFFLPLLEEADNETK